MTPYTCLHSHKQIHIVNHVLFLGQKGLGWDNILKMLLIFNIGVANVNSGYSYSAMMIEELTLKLSCGAFSLLKPGRCQGTTRWSHLSICAGRTCSDAEMGRAVNGTIRVGRGAAEQTSILWKGLRDHKGADLL